MRSLMPWGKQKERHATAKRAFFLLLLFSVFFSYLGVRLFCLQVFGYAETQEKVMEEITVASGLRAVRGSILDTNGHPLAITKTVYRISISPKNIALREKEDKTTYASLVAEGLSSILGISEETILKKAKKTSLLDETVAKSVDEKTAQRVLGFIEEKGLYGLIATEANSSRYYPNGSLASHVIGFTGSDGQGLFGLEYYYDDDLAGKDGRYLLAVDAHGNEESYGYTTYEAPKNGLNLVTTLDSYIQRELEATLSEIIEEFNVRNRATGIVMNVNTGAILAMATAPSFDLNSPYEPDPLTESLLNASGLAVGSEEYRAKKNELLLEMWQNKPVSTLYEPGSTFKIVTSAMALDLGVTSPGDSSFHCGGSYSPVSGVRISCWRRIGHGSGFTYSYGLQQSCNCAMMQVVARIGSERFYQYFKAFGLLEKTGIDLPSEAGSLFHTLKGLGTVELATSSFGQRFKVTPLAELTAIATVANGGYVVTPHLIDRLTDAEGNTVFQYETKVKRQAVSSAAAQSVAAILEEGVSGEGASRNAYAAGYRIAAKTGTSEKLDKADANGNFSLRIGSCVAFAPYDNPEIAMIIVVDEPTTAHYGATVAAPYISRMMSLTLPYLGYEPIYKPEEEAMREVIVGNYIGMSVREAEAALKKLGVRVEAIGLDPGDSVTAQTPSAGSTLHVGLGQVILRGEKSSDTTTVPTLSGLTVADSIKCLIDAGLNIRLSGTAHSYGDAAPTAVSQSIAAGTAVPRGTVIVVTFLYNDKE